MQLLYNGIDILNHKGVALSSCVVTDNAGGVADTLELVFSDTSGLWGIWRPAFDDVVEWVQDGWGTGKMYIDDITDTDTIFRIGARSLPPAARQSGTTAWENVRFSKIASDLAVISGLTVRSHNITDYNYVRFDRKNESSLQALNRLCQREGYALKVTNGVAIIYGEKSFENFHSTGTIQPKIYSFKNQDIGRRGVELRWTDGAGELIQGAAVDDAINAETEIITDIPVYSVAEAQRWSAGYLRQFNKHRKVGHLCTDRDLTLAAGNVVTVDVSRMFAGDYFIEQIKHEFVGGSKSHYKVRGSIGGDY